MMADRTIRILIDASRAVRNSNSLSGALGKVGKIAAQVGISVAAMSAIIAKNADTWNRLETQLKTVTDSQTELLKAQEDVIAISIRTNTSLEASVNLYARLKRATKELGTSEEDILKVTESINQAFIVSGASAIEAENAILQLSQGLASGVFRGEEFNSVAEQGPRLLKALSDSLGKTQGELRQLANDGKLTSEIVVKAIREQSEALKKEFKDVNPTIGASLTNLQTKFIEVSSKIDKVIKATFGKSLTKAVTDSIDFITEKLDEFLKNLNNVEISQLTKSITEANKELAEARKLDLEFAKAITAETKGQYILELERDNALALNLKNKKKILELEKQIFAENKRLSELGIAAGVVPNLGPNAPKTEDEETDDRTAAEILASNERTTALIEAAKKEIKDLARQQDLIEEQAANDAKLELARAANQEEIDNILRAREAKIAIEKGFLTQEQIDLQDSLRFKLEKIQENANEEAQVLKDINAVRFEEEQRIKEEQFLLRLEAEGLEEEQIRAIIQERNAARLEELRLFGEEQVKIVGQTEEAKKAVIEQNQEETTRLKKLQENARFMDTTDELNKSLDAIASFGKNSEKLTKGIAFAQASIYIAQGISVGLSKGWAGIPEALDIAAKGAPLLAKIKSTSSGSGGTPTISGDSSGSSSSTPSTVNQPDAQSIQQGIENTQINELRRELSEYDPNDVLPIGMTRRIVDSIINGRADGTVEDL